MPDLTEDELAEKISEAVDKEHRAIAGDQFFREALMAVAEKVRAGIYDGYIFEIGTELYAEFKEKNPMTKKKKKEEEEKEKVKKKRGGSPANE
jgi:hypothetical protein